MDSKELERHRQYRRLHSDRYNYAWNKTHEEARQILENSDKDPSVCYSCGEGRKTHCHHVDGDPYNNDISNLEWCCQPCDSRQNDRRYVRW